MPDSEISLAIKYGFSKMSLIDANAEGQRHILEVKENNDNIVKSITSFTTNEFQMYKPYFTAIDKYTRADYEREYVFLKKAIEHVTAMIELKSEQTELYNNDVSACVDIITNLLNPVISTP